MVNAVILAGGRKEDYQTNFIERWMYKGIFIPGEKKAVLEFNGKSSISYVTSALKKAESIDNIAVVGNTELLKERGVRDVKILEQGDSIIDNFLIGYESFEKKGRTLIATADTPGIRYKTIDDFVKKADGDFCVSITPKEILKSMINYLEGFILEL